MYKVYVVEYDGYEYNSVLMEVCDNEERAYDRLAELRAETGCSGYVVDEEMEELEELYNDMMPCDYSGYCGGMNCRNFMNCKGGR